LFDGNAPSGFETLARRFHARDETRIVFELVIEPVIFVLENDQHGGRPPVARNDDLLLRR